MSGKLNELTATEILRLYHSREVKISEVVGSCLQQIDILEPYIHAWVCLNREEITEKAAELDQKLSASEKVGRLAGIPVGVKDIYNTSDMPTAMGSPIWDGFTPGNDARVVSKLRLQDALMLGKTVTAEFAVHYNDTTANPHNIEHSPGTSSSGSAAAVA
ncbi:MAG: amidase family protein, partial [Chitinophagales bacterium]